MVLFGHRQGISWNEERFFSCGKSCWFAVENTVVIVACQIAFDNIQLWEDENVVILYSKLVLS
jgi:hypothetical protein